MKGNGGNPPTLVAVGVLELMCCSSLHLDVVCSVTSSCVAFPFIGALPFPIRSLIAHHFGRQLCETRHSNFYFMHQFSFFASLLVTNFYHVNKNKVWLPIETLSSGREK